MTTTTPSTKPAPITDSLPRWKVILHNDNVNVAEFVVAKVQEITRMSEHNALEKVLEAHERGKVLLLVTHKEKAELIVERFEGHKITVTMEKDSSQ